MHASDLGLSGISSIFLISSSVRCEDVHGGIPPAASDDSLTLRLCIITLGAH
jgi:hypothetical protein